VRLSHKYKFIFIAIPKTGSSSIRYALNDYSDIRSKNDPNSPYAHHVPASKLKEHIGCWEEYFKFAFVRNPWDLVVSSYFYQQEAAEDITRNVPQQFLRQY